MSALRRGAKGDRPFRSFHRDVAAGFPCDCAGKFEAAGEFGEA
jgi:hypothetical protein